MRRWCSRCKFPDQPAVDGAEQQFAIAGALAAAFNVVEDPFQLGAREVRVGDQTGGLADVLLMAVAFELFADLGTASALPNDRVVDGTAADFVPHNGGFALVSDTNGGHLVMMQTGLCQGFNHYGTLGGENFHRVVLNPAGLRVVLLELTLCGANHVGVTIKDDRSRAGGALVQRNDVVLILNVGHGIALQNEVMGSGRESVNGQ